MEGRDGSKGGAREIRGGGFESLGREWENGRREERVKGKGS